MVTTVLIKSLIANFTLEFNINILSNWLTWGAIGAILLAAGKVFWSIYGKAIQDWLQPHAKQHIKQFAKRTPFPPQSEPEPARPQKEATTPTPMQSESESPVGKSAPNPPDYRKDYREDIIEGIKWEWEWTEEATDRPRINLQEIRFYRIRLQVLSVPL